MEFQDIVVERHAGVATITINRPRSLNAFTVHTVDELIAAFTAVGEDRTIGAIILTGAGDRAFSAGGDQKQREASGHERDERGREMRSIELYQAIRGTPQPVIAAVNGYAIGGGHVLHVLCDVTIASETAIFGQVGARVGSWDAGFGTICLARVVGEKRAREMWFFTRKYSAEQALAMGLVNAVVPAAQLMDEARAWAAELLEKSPTALRYLKQSFNADTAGLSGHAAMAFTALELYQESDEAKEGMHAFLERRPVDYSAFRRSA